MRLMCAAGVSLVFGLLLACSDDKKPIDQNISRADQLAAMKKKFEKEMDELKKKYSNAKDIAEQQGIREEARELAVLTSRDALKIAEADPKDKDGFEAAWFVIDKALYFKLGKEFDAAIEIIGEHHLNNAKVTELLQHLSSASPTALRGFQSFLEKASDKAQEKEARALAYFYIGKIASDQLQEEDETTKVNELVAKSTQNFKKAADIAPNGKIGTTTIGMEVNNQIEALKAITNLAVGKPVPEIEGTDLNGKKVKLSSYQGKVVLVDLWFTGCPPCRAMIPHEREVVKKLEKKPFKLLSVSCDEDQETLTKFFESEPMPWDHWFDGPRGSVAKAFRVNAFPTLYLIDHTGVIRNKVVGFRPGDEIKLGKAVDDLVAEAMKAKG